VGQRGGTSVECDAFKIEQLHPYLLFGLGVVVMAFLKSLKL
jgi:hypothetical protein